MRSSAERADGTAPCGGEDRLGRHTEPLPGDDAGSTLTRRTVADTVQQSEAVGDADTAWLTVAHTTHLVRAAALEPVTRSCMRQ